MCEYSLMAYSNRIATTGEELVVHRFDTGTVGLASASELDATSPPACSRNLAYRIRTRKSCSPRQAPGEFFATHFVFRTITKS
jgi:hypothetical protein